jgi:molecular chaperone DnaK
MVYQGEKQLTDLGDKVAADMKSTVEEAIGSAKKVLEDQAASTEDLKQAKDSLLKSLEVIGKQVYENAGAAAGACDPAAGASADTGNESGSGSSGESKEEDIVEADFEVVDEGKDEDKDKS